MIPVYILSFNRLTCLRELVTWFEGAEGCGEIVIIDSASTYPPLLDYLNETSHRVVRMPSNLGPEGAFRIIDSDVTRVFAVLDGRPAGPRSIGYRAFAFTDPDCIPREDCPTDLLTHLIRGAYEHKAGCVGVGLEITDIPPTYKYRNDVLRVEAPYWTSPVGEFFKASVDTTLGVYLGDRTGSQRLRSNYPYVARHSTWYLDLDDLPDDEKWYAEHPHPIAGHWNNEKATGLGRMNWRRHGGTLGDVAFGRAERIVEFLSEGAYSLKRKRKRRVRVEE